MSALHRLLAEDLRPLHVRVLAGVLAVIVVVDALNVAPPLVVFAVPYALAAWLYRERGTLTDLALGLWCALQVVIGVNYALTNGFHMDGEVIPPGDALLVYVGTPLAAFLCLELLGAVVRHARHPHGAA